MILNDIKNKFRLVNAYEDWKDYRLLLTDTVIEAGGGDSTKTLSVIGAGYCNDIDIRRLSAAFEKIYLVDCDAEREQRTVPCSHRTVPHIVSSN